MTTWILWIAKEFPTHWDLARQHELWDLLRPVDVRRGDDVFFWQAGPRSRILGWTRATTDAVPLEPQRSGPWLGADYRRRFHFTLVSDAPASRPRWGEVAAATGLTPAPMTGVVKADSPGAQAFLRSLFEAEAPRVDLYFSDDVQVRLEGLLEDTRERSQRSIALRRGQREFRAALLSAYQGRCAITGSTVGQILEAAHISPHRGQQTNIVQNGLLLRGDVHTLFDLHLVTIDAGLTVRIAPELMDTEYASYDSQRLVSIPRLPRDRPNDDAIQYHRLGCTWLAEKAAAMGGRHDRSGSPRRS